MPASAPVIRMKKSSKAKGSLGGVAYSHFVAFDNLSKRLGGTVPYCCLAGVFDKAILYQSREGVVLHLTLRNYVGQTIDIDLVPTPSDSVALRTPFLDVKIGDLAVFKSHNGDQDGPDKVRIVFGALIKSNCKLVLVSEADLSADHQLSFRRIDSSSWLHDGWQRQVDVAFDVSKLDWPGFLKKPLCDHFMNWKPPLGAVAGASKGAPPMQRRLAKKRDLKLQTHRQSDREQTEAQLFERVQWPPRRKGMGPIGLPSSLLHRSAKESGAKRVAGEGTSKTPGEPLMQKRSRKAT
ncbi:uncharacterized protein PFL1_00114 [Pseudozyma flocculosa PF-1]|uniref:Uncharacterized protein n=1 Tax=Pseudozyma flocculosa TaxID=84751 RepID=A0A5C3ET09_9BASI|nr:uncharacterized protein PFL1_00114 [Pseudozyma flocculosa PF-1]EPQ31915.1 hypothetical protein PFL1_00114 [Pseudozyma flocculosa PF-1]SPO35172.1 uncharacterized protein PSFLO_00643 [Pseudozyma flocculosa]